MMIHWGEETSLCSWPVLWATKLGSYLQAKSWQAQGSAHWCLFVWFTHHWGGAVSREHQEFWLGRHPWWHALLFLQGELLISSDSMGNCLLQASILVCIDGLQILDSFLSSSFWTEQRLLPSFHWWMYSVVGFDLYLTNSPYFPMQLCLGSLGECSVVDVSTDMTHWSTHSRDWLQLTGCPCRRFKFHCCI